MKCINKNIRLPTNRIAEFSRQNADGMVSIVESYRKVDAGHTKYTNYYQ